MQVEESEGPCSHDRREDFTANIHQHYPAPFVGIAEITLFWDWNTLTLFPSVMICLTVEEVGDVFMDDPLLRVVHGFESFWGGCH